MKKLIWLSWLTLTIALGSFWAYKMFSAEDKSELLIGEASHGHFQIEMACTTCHTEAFGGEEVIQDACTNCHQEELKAAHDSHPKKKFTDPRNADRLEILDARYCVTCHTEHQKEQTHDMGVTIPEDYCFHCHQDVGEERESHKDLPFDSCASSGCHNYHDNRALYERFLVENNDGPWVKAMAKIAGKNGASVTAPHAMEKLGHHAIKAAALNSPHSPEDDIHLAAGIGCVSCHQADEINHKNWIEKPSVKQCQTCHAQEADGYLKGKHGMRLAESLTPMTAAQSSLPFKSQANQIEHGCTTCHQAHDFNTKTAAVEACLGCHNDEHSTNFSSSPHGQLNASVQAGELPEEQGVTCATCHMPRLEKDFMGQKVIMVEHNQNDNLRPNEKMIRPVCMSCHSLEFSIDALADEDLIKRNFNGQPAEHIPSIDWAIKRDQ